jgi:hypothetical protein
MIGTIKKIQQKCTDDGREHQLPATIWKANIDNNEAKAIIFDRWIHSIHSFIILIF